MTASQLILAVQLLVILWQGLTALSHGHIEGAHRFMLLLLTLGVQEGILGGSNSLANFGLGYTALKRIDHQYTHTLKKDQHS